MSDWRAIGRQAVWDEFQRRPERARPRRAPGLHSSLEAKAYWFGDQIRLAQGDTAGAIVAWAAADAQAVVRGASVRIAAGTALLLGGFGGVALIGRFPPVTVAMLFLFYHGVTTVRSGTDRYRRAAYDRRLASDVEAYAKGAIAAAPAHDAIDLAA